MSRLHWAAMLVAGAVFFVALFLPPPFHSLTMFACAITIVVATVRAVPREKRLGDGAGR